MLSVLFVHDDAGPGGDGAAWESAYDDLQDALSQAATINADGDAGNDVDQIWIAEGVYKPSAELEPGDPRSASFSLLRDVALYGGFAGTEATLEDRDFSAYVTTLSGDLGVAGDVADNGYTVVYSTAIRASLDGLLITGGNADGSEDSDHLERSNGGGIYNHRPLTVTNCTLSGNSANYGGAVCSYSTLTMTSSTVSDNSAVLGGGGVYNGDRGTLTVTQCTLSGNSAGRGGAVYNRDTVALTDSTISNNSADYGGGIYGYGGTLTVTDSALSDNSARSGSGIYNRSTLTMTNSTFSGNSADDYGGGLYNENWKDRTSTVTGCTFSANSSNNHGGGIYNRGVLTVTSSTFTSNFSDLGGGGICNRSGLKITNCTFSDNVAVQGGGVYNYSVLTVTNCTLSGNSADRGGGISNEGTLTLNNSIVARNAALYSPDVNHYHADGSLTGSHNLIGDRTGQTRLYDGNNGNLVGTADAPIDPLLLADFRLQAGSPAVDAGDNGLIPPEITTDLAGAIRIQDGDNDGTATVDMGAYEDAVGGPYLTISDASVVEGDSVIGNMVFTVTLSEAAGYDVTFDYVTRDGTAQAGIDYAARRRRVIIPAGETTATIMIQIRGETDPEPDETFFVELSSSVGIVHASGVGCILNDDTLVVTTLADVVDATDGLLSFREALLTGGSTVTFDPALYAEGPATVLLAGSELAIERDVVIDGPGTELLSIDAGGASRVFSIDKRIAVSLVGLTITGGSTEENGGGIYSRGPLTVTNCVLSGNSAENGGGIYSDQTTLAVANSTLSNNSAVVNGGGFYNYDSTVTLANSTLSSNAAEEYGGGACNRGRLTAINSAFSGNSAESGGGMSNTYGDGTYDYGTPTVTNCTFSDNLATGGTGYLNLPAAGGAGIYNTGEMIVTNCAISANSAERFGGGIYNRFGKVTVTDSTLWGNLGGGGGIHNESGIVNVFNSVFFGNSARGVGGGISNYSGTVKVTNSTFVGNSAEDGGGIFNYLDSDLTVNNSILWMNHGGELDIRRDILPSGNLIGVDPRFVRVPWDGGDGWGDKPHTPDVDESANDDLGDLRLMPESPAINHAGNDLAIDADGNPLATDHDGNPRIYGTTVDAGAYEFQSAPSTGRENASLTVTTSEDVVDLYDGQISLREAIYYAGTYSPGTAITFDGVLDGATIRLTGTALWIDKGLTVNASTLTSLTVDAGRASRVFAVVASEEDAVALSHLTITGGSADDEGGGIYNCSGTLTIADSMIRGNSAKDLGGGISNSGTLTLVNSTLSDNSVCIDGGGIYNYLGTLTVVNSTLSDNSAARQGGAIACYGGSLTLDNSIAANNTAPSIPDLYIYSGTITASHNLIGNGTGQSSLVDGTDGNLVGSSDAPIDPLLLADGCLRPGSPAIDAGDNGLVPLGITTDLAGAARIQDGNGDGTATVNMGAQEGVVPGPYLSVSDASVVEGDSGTAAMVFTVTLSDVVDYDLAFDYVTQDGTAQAGIDYAAGRGSTNIPAGETTATITVRIRGDMAPESDETFFLILSSSAGFLRAPGVGSILNDDALVVTTLADIVDPSDDVVSFREALIHDTSIVTFDPALYAEGPATIALGGSELTVAKDVTVEGPGAELMTIDAGGVSRVFWIEETSSVSLSGLTITGGSTDSHGGGIYSRGTLTVTSCMLLGNSAEGRGGGIYDYNTLTVTKTTLLGNTAGESGGGIYIDDGGILTLTDSALSDNAAGTGGGIFSFWRSILTLTNSTISANTADIGGGIRNYHGTLVVTNGTFSHNAAETHGGGIYSEDGVLTIGDSTFSGNSAQDEGGGVYSDDDTLAITGSVLTGNSAESGGGICNHSTTLTVADCTFSGNSAYSSIYPTLGMGGGICNWGPLTVIASTFADNEAISSGGGVYNSGRLTAVNSTLSGNAAGFGGGGIYNYKYGTLTLNNSTLSNNRADQGGGIYNSDGTVTLLNSVIRGNTADSKGGGVSNDGTLKLTNSTLLGNSADQGGGIYNYSALTITNCTLSGNSADRGGGIHSHGSLTLTNSTLAGNFAGQGGGISIHGGTLKFNNSVIAKNAASSSPDFHTYHYRTLTASHNLIGDGTDQTAIVDGVDGNLVGTSENPIDPLFIRNPSDGGDGWGDDPDTPDIDESVGDDYGDLRLQVGSPAIDAGDSTLLPADTYDLDGDEDLVEPVPFDLDGNARIVAETVDIGAYEYFVPLGIPGDLNDDYHVNSDDLNVIRINWGRTVPPGSLLDGDPSGDGKVNSDDLDIIRANWGSTLPVAAAAGVLDATDGNVGGVTLSGAVYGPRKATDAAMCDWGRARLAWAEAVEALSRGERGERGGGVTTVKRAAVVDLAMMEWGEGRMKDERSRDARRPFLPWRSSCPNPSFIPSPQPQVPRTRTPAKNRLTAGLRTLRQFPRVAILLDGPGNSGEKLRFWCRQSVTERVDLIYCSACKIVAEVFLVTHDPV